MVDHWSFFLQHYPIHTLVIHVGRTVPVPSLLISLTIGFTTINLRVYCITIIDHSHMKQTYWNINQHQPTSTRIWGWYRLIPFVSHMPVYACSFPGAMTATWPHLRFDWWRARKTDARTRTSPSGSPRWLRMGWNWPKLRNMFENV